MASTVKCFLLLFLLHNSSNARWLRRWAAVMKRWAVTALRGAKTIRTERQKGKCFESVMVRSPDCFGDSIFDCLGRDKEAGEMIQYIL
jgi:hypothetical protein